MSDYSRYAVRWQDGSYDPYRIPSVKRTYTDVAGCTGSLLEDEILTSNAQNALIDQELAAPKAVTSVDPDYLEDSRKSNSSPFTPSEYTHVRRAFNELSLKQKKAWRLVMQEGLTEEAAGVQLQISASAVHGLISRAKKVFADCIKGEINCNENN